jgi:4-hydroxy-3-methylbut-2-en-1-yl diphosphate reductase
VKFEIEKALHTGFCFGVKRAVEIVTKAAAEYGRIETLGAVVHNPQVMAGLGKIGIEAVRNIEDIKGKTVITSSHGVSPGTEEKIRARGIDIIETRCGNVRRAQVVAKRLAEAGFFVVVFGDVNHPEVQGILGWIGNKGIATVDVKDIAALGPLPKHIGILSQTTQVADNFKAFAQKAVAIALVKDAEIRIIDTICHDLRERQLTALGLAQRVDLMLVVGGRISANSNHLATLCSTVVKTYLIETAGDIDASWFEDCRKVGVTSGSSTAEETIGEVIARLEEISQPDQIPL